jgi:hypothetical protein
MIIVLFALLALAAIFQGPSLQQLRRHSHPSPSPSASASP